jgi:predicted Zn-dependent protease
MKKNEPDIQDIYREDKRRGEEPKTPVRMSDMIGREIRKQWIFGLLVGLLFIILLVTIASALVRAYFPSTRDMVPSEKRIPYVATYTLPADEQWAIEYQQIAFQADSSSTERKKSISTKWLKNAAYHIIIGEQALRLGNPAVAQEHLEMAQATFPTMSGLHHLLGEVYLKQHAPDKAVKELQAALEENPSVDVLNNLGVAYAETGEYKKAEELLNRALRQQPALAGIQKNLARLYQRAGQTDKAISAFNTYFQSNPQDTELLKMYVAYLTEAGRIPDAVTVLSGLDGADPLAVQLMIARAAAQQDDADLAIRSLKEVARFLTPRQTIAEMHNEVFDKISKTEAFETLIERLELASVSLSTNLSPRPKSIY